MTWNRVSTVSLADARRKADEVRTTVANGNDPSDVRKEAKVAQQYAIENQKRIDDGLPALDSFEFMALEWFEKRMLNKSQSHQQRTMGFLKRDLFPWIGKRPIAEIKAPELLKVLRRIEARNAIESAHRALQTCGQVFRYAEAWVSPPVLLPGIHLIGSKREEYGGTGGYATLLKISPMGLLPMSNEPAIRWLIQSCKTQIVLVQSRVRVCRRCQLH